MKFSSIRFLSKANINGNPKSNSVVVLALLFTVALTLVSSFSLTVRNAVNDYKKELRARSIIIQPDKLITESEIKAIKNIEHVEAVYPAMSYRYTDMCVEEISDMPEVKKRIDELSRESDDAGSYVYLTPTIGDEDRSVIAGKTLGQSEDFSVLVPAYFYPYGDYYDVENSRDKYDMDYIDGVSLIGKTITIKADEKFGYSYPYQFKIDWDGVLVGYDIKELPSFPIKLKVVGTYLNTATTLYYNDLLVSESTLRTIDEMELKAAGYDMNDDKNDTVYFYHTPSLHEHYVVLDEYDNNSYVVNKLRELGYITSEDSTALWINPNTITISNILSVVGTLLVAATALLCAITVIQSSALALQNRRGELGLLKAIGYKNKDIFAFLTLEQLLLTLKGFLFGGAFSAVFVFIANTINSHRSYHDRMYIVRWSDFIILLSISLATLILIPIVCRLISLYKLSKIQPKDAMAVR